MKNSTKKIILIITLIITTCIIACNDESPIAETRNVLGVSSNNDNIVALFRVCSWHRWHSDNITTKGLEPPYYLLSSNHCWAYISDGVRFVNPALINCNGEPMMKLEDGQYEYSNHNGHLSSIHWNVNNILGHSYNFTDVNISKIVFTNINNDDTLDISQGLNIQYTGRFEDICSILVTIRYDYYLGFADERIFRFDKFFPNNGSIVLTAEDLASFPTSIDGLPSRGYIELSHKKYVEEEFRGRTVAKLFETSMLTWVTLKRDF